MSNSQQSNAVALTVPLPLARTSCYLSTSHHTTTYPLHPLLPDPQFSPPFSHFFLVIMHHASQLISKSPFSVEFRLTHFHRTHALHKHRPISLYPTIHPPSLDELPSDRPIAIGLELLVNLYKPFDDTFFSIWNKVRSHANPTWLAQLQSQLSEALPPYLECTEIQAVDLRVSQQWLRTMVWQLCVSQGLVSSVAADAAMTFKYPIEISRDLLSLTHQFSQQAMEAHGVGLVSVVY